MNEYKDMDGQEEKDGGKKNAGQGIQLKYAALQSNYWMLYCVVFSYIAVYLSAKGFAAGKIGLLVAAGNVIGAVLQPWFAALADKGGRLTLRDYMMWVSATGVLPAVLLFILPTCVPLTVTLFLIAMSVVNILQPLTIAVNGYYMSRGHQMNFGLARGIGSMTYAIFSMILGYLVTSFGVRMIPAAMIILMVSITLITTVFPMDKEAAGTETAPQNEEKQPGGNLLVKYKTFFLLLFGIVVMFTFHNIVNTYLFQIMEKFGGNSADMGVSLSLAAVCEMPAMFLFAWLIRKVRANQLIRIAALGFLVKAIVIFLADSVMLVHVSQMFQAISFAVLIPASVYYSDEMMEEQDRVKGQAFITASYAIGGVLGNLLGGIIIDWKGVSAMLFAGVVCAVAGLALMWAGAVPPKAGRRKAG